MTIVRESNYTLAETAKSQISSVESNYAKAKLEYSRWKKILGEREAKQAMEVKGGAEPNPAYVAEAKAKVREYEDEFEAQFKLYNQYADAMENTKITYIPISFTQLEKLAYFDVELGGTACEARAMPVHRLK